MTFKLQNEKTMYLHIMNFGPMKKCGIWCFYLTIWIQKFSGAWHNNFLIGLLTFTTLINFFKHGFILKPFMYLFEDFAPIVSKGITLFIFNKYALIFLFAQT